MGLLTPTELTMTGDNVSSPESRPQETGYLQEATME